MSSDWWSKKMGAPVQQPSYQQPVQQPVQPMQQAPSYAPQQPIQPPAPSCPGCRSANYIAVGSQVTQNGSVPTYRCYDCGYPIVQAGSGRGGATSAPSQGPVQKAKQVETGGWNPTTIVDRLG
jgi:chitodextrinase